MRTRFVLINTSHAGNVGAAARAMRVMGFDDLVLVPLAVVLLLAGVTMNAPMPFAPLRSPGKSVRAMTMMTSASLPCDTHAFAPLMIQSAPSRTACGWR